MEKKFPTTVTIGGRRYVKKNLDKNTAGNCRMMLKDVTKSLGRRVQRSQLSQCVIDCEDSMEIYGSADIRVIFSKSNKPIGFLVAGAPENIDKNKYKDVPDDLERTVEDINNISLSEDKKQEDCTPDID